MTEVQEAVRRMMTEPTVSVMDAALILGVSEQTARRAIDAGEIEHTRIGRTIRVLSAPLKRKVGLE